MQPVIKRKILEPQLFTNHPINVKTTIDHLPSGLQLHIKDHLPDHAEVTRGANKTQLTSSSQNSVTLDYQFICTSRGSHQFNDVTITFSDYWQLFKTEQFYQVATKFMVHSDPVEVKKAKQVSTREHVELTIPSLFGS